MPNEKVSHTPGPWRYENTPGAGLQIFGTMPQTFTFGEGVIPQGKEVKVFGLPENIRVFGSGERLIAYERWVRFEPDEWSAMQEANARLIAAAPDLLYALQLMVSRECGCFNSKNPDWHSDKCFKDIALKAIAKAEGR